MYPCMHAYFVLLCISLLGAHLANIFLLWGYKCMHLILQKNTDFYFSSLENTYIEPLNSLIFNHFQPRFKPIHMLTVLWYTMHLAHYWGEPHINHTYEKIACTYVCMYVVIRHLHAHHACTCAKLVRSRSSTLTAC